MGWRMIGKPLDTASMSGIPTITQKFKTDENCFLGGYIVATLLYNDPAFTNMYLEVWSDRSGSPAKLITTSDVKTKAEILLVNDHAYKVLGFDFNNKIPLRTGAYYHLAIRCSAYTGDSTSHVAWVTSYPDPQYTVGVTTDAAHADNHPLFAVAITASA